MQLIENTEFGGERPLFGRRALDLRGVIFLPGESALKCTAAVSATGCDFNGKYPLWHTDGFTVADSVFRPDARAAIWYSRNGRMERCRVDAPKMFREVDGLVLRDVEFTDAEETLWHCANVDIRDCSVVKADYLFMHSHDITIDHWTQQGNYSFQYCRNVEIRNARIDSKDAFWATENVTIYDSELTGEYLGWHSRRLRLVRCRISGTQPLCYCSDLILEDCVFAPDCDLAFEDSEVNARILSPVTSIKNPRAGRIEVAGVGEVITDGFSKAVEPVDIDIVG